MMRKISIEINGRVVKGEVEPRLFVVRASSVRRTQAALLRSYAAFFSPGSSQFLTFLSDWNWSHPKGPTRIG